MTKFDDITLAQVKAFIDSAQSALNEHLDIEDDEEYEAAIDRMVETPLAVAAPWGEEKIHVYRNDIDEPVPYVSCEPLTLVGSVVVDYAGPASGWIDGIPLTIG